MNSEVRLSTASLIARLASSPPRYGEEEGGTVGLRLEILGEAVQADACALVWISLRDETVTLLGGRGLRDPSSVPGWVQPSGYLARAASECRHIQHVFSTQPPPGDPFLSAEGTEQLLLACMEGAGVLAIRRTDTPFSTAEISRFAAVSYVLNMEMIRGLTHGGGKGSGARDPVTGLGLFPEFHRTLGRELSRNRRKTGRVTAGILSLEPGEGQGPGEEDVVFVAGVLARQLRDFDTIVRYSGRELAFILPDLGGEEAARVVDRVLKEIISEKEGTLPSIHIGFSSYPDDATTVERIIETAEAAVNLAREKGTYAVSRWND
jgi:GGDEF domain-containing protein